MAKDKDKKHIFLDDVQWGNQETDSLSHEEILTYSPLKKTKAQIEVLTKIAQERAKDPEWIAKNTEANRAKWKDPAYHAKISKAQKEKWDNPEYREKMLSYYNTPEYKEYISERNRKVAIRDHDKIVKKNQTLAKDPKWLEANAKAQANRSENNEEWIRKNCRPVSTPYGIFKRVKEAIEAYCAHHPEERYASVNLKLRRWYKSNKKPEWAYLTWEEYDKQSK